MITREKCLEICAAAHLAPDESELEGIALELERMLDYARAVSLFAESSEQEASEEAFCSEPREKLGVEPQQLLACAEQSRDGCFFIRGGTDK